MFVCLLLLMVLADASNGHAVLPAFVLGLVMSRHYFLKGRNPRHRALFRSTNHSGFWIRVGNKYPNPDPSHSTKSNTTPPGRRSGGLR